MNKKKIVGRVAAAVIALTVVTGTAGIEMASAYTKYPVKQTYKPWRP
jgi:hypothetical protein